MEFWQRLEVIAEQYDVLRHPFYVRWTEGTLSRDELASYAGQYRHAVLALATAAARAAASPEAGADAPALAVHAAQEAAHVELWDEFLAAVGGDADASPTEQTLDCAETWAGDQSRSLLETLTAMYMIESAQPAIARTKANGLAHHYGIDSARYFELHEQLDVEHADHARELIAGRLAGADETALLATAAATLEANWRLLDGVELAGARR